MWRFIALYGMSEMAQRVTRLATTVLLARTMSAVDLGIAAMAITCFEVMRVVANSGIAQAVIRATDARLAGTCVTAYRLFWAVCIALTAAQLAVGAGIGAWTGHWDVMAMIACLGGVYLMMPMGIIQCCLIQRSSRHGTMAAVGATQAVTDNLLTIGLALAGFGAWAIVLPKLLTCPIWVAGMRRGQVWTPDRSAIAVPQSEIVRFALPVLGAEMVTTLRLQLDKMMVGAMLGIEALGIYYFIFNAGIGLTLALTGVLSNSLYPHFASVADAPRTLLERLDRSLLTTSLPIAGVVVLQAAMAQVYVPLLFGAQWTAYAWMVGVLCLSASTKLLSDSGSLALRAAGATRFDFAGTLVVTCASLTGLAAGMMFGLAGGVIALAVASGVSQLGFAVMARQRVAGLVYGRSDEPDASAV